MNATIRALVIARSNGLCEACRRPLNGRGEVDHFWGKARAESVETCWLLHPECHRAKTDSVGGAVHWIQLFIEHQQLHGYDPSKALLKLAWRKTLAMLPFGRKGRAA